MRLAAGLLALGLAALGLTPRLVVLPGALRDWRAVADTASYERVTCLIGARLMNLVLVTDALSPVIDTTRWAREHHARPSSMLMATRVIYTDECDQFAGVVGVMHNHPGAARCWYYFPTTVVGTSDLVSAARSPYPVDAILCGGRVVWLFQGRERSTPAGG